MGTEFSVFMMLLAFFLIFLNAFFVLSEFSIVKIRKSKIEEFVKDDVDNSAIALEIVNNLDTYLSATQLGITLSSLALGWIGEPAFSRIIEYPLKHFFGASNLFISSVSFIVAFTFITLLHVVLGELVPKSIAIANTEKVVLKIVKPLYIFWVIFSPIIKTFDFLAAFALKMLGLKNLKESATHSEEEIRIIVGESLKGGVLDSTESEIIQNAVSFSDTIAKEIMTPRSDMVCLNKQDSLEENLEVIKTSKFTRFVYIDDDKDNVIGIIHVRDILLNDLKNENTRDFDNIARSIMIVPENNSISKILTMMNKERVSAALVVDEYGGTSGLITMEDIVEELVGDINDEHDEELSAEFKKLSENSYEIIGRFEVEDFENLMNFSFDEELEQVTIGGYVFNLFERLPNVGDIIEDDYFTYEVTEMNATSIQSLKVSRKNILQKTLEKIKD